MLVISDHVVRQEWEAAMCFLSLTSQTSIALKVEVEVEVL